METPQHPLEEGAVSVSIAQVGKLGLEQEKESEAMGTSMVLGFGGTHSTGSSKHWLQGAWSSKGVRGLREADRATEAGTATDRLGTIMRGQGRCASWA